MPRRLNRTYGGGRGFRTNRVFRGGEKSRGYSDFRRIHNPETLLEASSQSFSAVKPWTRFSPCEKSWNLGQWRLMESPLFFLIRNRCLLAENNEPIRFNQVYGDCGEDPYLYGEAEKPENPEEVAKFEESDLVPVINSALLNGKRRKVANWIDRKRLAEVLSAQLGPKIRNGDLGAHFTACLDDPEKRWRFGLFAALLLHGHSDERKKDALRIFDAMNESVAKNGVLAPENVDIGDAPELWGATTLPGLDFPWLHKSYENVLFMALLDWARTRGVLPSSMFGWVKAFDRTLWYALNQTGRSVCSAEAAGIWSHLWAEEAMQRPLDEPYMEIAIDGFETEMAIEGWIPGPGKKESDAVEDWLAQGCPKDDLDALAKRGGHWRDCARAYVAGYDAAVRDMRAKFRPASSLFRDFFDFFKSSRGGDGK